MLQKLYKIIFILSKIFGEVNKHTPLEEYVAYKVMLELLTP